MLREPAKPWPMSSSRATKRRGSKPGRRETDHRPGLLSVENSSPCSHETTIPLSDGVDSRLAPDRSCRVFRHSTALRELAPAWLADGNSPFKSKSQDQRSEVRGQRTRQREAGSCANLHAGGVRTG